MRGRIQDPRQQSENSSGLTSLGEDFPPVLPRANAQTRKQKPSRSKAKKRSRTTISSSAQSRRDPRNRHDLRKTAATPSAHVGTSMPDESGLQEALRTLTEGDGAMQSNTLTNMSASLVVDPPLDGILGRSGNTWQQTGFGLEISSQDQSFYPETLSHQTIPGNNYTTHIPHTVISAQESCALSIAYHTLQPPSRMGQGFIPLIDRDGCYYAARSIYNPYCEQSFMADRYARMLKCKIMPMKPSTQVCYTPAGVVQPQSIVCKVRIPLAWDEAHELQTGFFVMSAPFYDADLIIGTNLANRLRHEGAYHLPPPIIQHHPEAISPATVGLEQPYTIRYTPPWFDEVRL